MTWTFSLDAPPAGDPDELRALLGGKGAGLAVMANELKLPVPPGFVISTEACKAYMADGWPDGLDAEVRERLTVVEQRMGRSYGDADDPLLLSVRSGAPVSMPGMLDTILNLGLNDETTAGLAEASGDAVFASGCRDRLGAMYRDSVGSDDVPDDPWSQLRGAIEAVFRSWDSDRARSYREREGIPADLGTAVVVQAMVFGNRGPDSATGVLFTRDPATGENQLYGDVLYESQGEDVVAGTHATEPIAVLEERSPEVAEELRGYATALERHFADVCDIEFTIEQGRLWMLQNRIGKRSKHAALRIAIEMAEDEDFPLTREEAVRRVAGILADPPMTVTRDTSSDVPVVAVGLPASPGLAVGGIATSPDRAVELADQGLDVILVRSETSPDDVHGMARAAGVLTSSGGLASHAAVVARGWDLPAVVGAGDVVVEHGRISIGARMWKEGDQISIDGSTGDVFGGAIVTKEMMARDAATMLRWAKELDIDIAAVADEGPSRSVGDAAEEGLPSDVHSTDDVVRSLGIKGYVTADLLAPALGTTSVAATELLDALVTGGLAAESGGMYSLSDAGKTRAAELLAEDKEVWGVDAAGAALDGFVALDGRMKEIVTAWQMREVDGEQVLNDHSDESHDAGVLADLAALHADAAAWISPCVDQLPRLRAYADRLTDAEAKAAAGDGRYVASPRVDSFHGVWFELHEDLIRLAGRTRKDEVAAGRA